MKSLFIVETNDREKILVKAEADDLVELYRLNKIYEYSLAKVYGIKEIK